MFTEVKPKDDEAWLKLRKGIITATDIATILGLNPYKSVKEMQESKETPTFTGNAYTFIGQALEPIVVHAFNHRMNTQVELFDTGSRSIFLSKSLKLGATPDAGNDEFLVECKSTKSANFLKYSYWPPIVYLSQLYCQLICTNRQYGYLAMLSCNLSQSSEELNLPLTIHRIERSSELDSIFLGEVKRYWQAVDDKKQFRVNRTQSAEVELKLRFGAKLVT